MRRHFTATAFVVRDGRTLLHWHRKLQQWMPPGGHLMLDEDPAAAALREVREETGIDAELIATSPTFDFPCPQQIAAPYTILLENSGEPGEPHQHIDLIYFCRPKDGVAAAPVADDSLLWVDAETLERNEPLPLPDGRRIPVAEDVRALGLAAIREAGTP